MKLFSISFSIPNFKFSCFSFPCLVALLLFLIFESFFLTSLKLFLSLPFGQFVEIFCFYLGQFIQVVVFLVQVLFIFEFIKYKIKRLLMLIY